MNAFFGISSGHISISGNQHIVPIDQWCILIDKTQLDELQKMTIQTRIISVVKTIQFRLAQYSIAYTILRTSTTVGSILIPSLLAFQTTASPEAINIGMWALGLIVGFSNAFMSLFKIDKNYFSLGDLLERIESEAWMYVSLSGRYRPISYTDEDSVKINFHKEYFNIFIERCEYLLHKAVRSDLQQSTRQSQPTSNYLSNGTSTTNSVGGDTTGTDLYNPMPQYRNILQKQDPSPKRQLALNIQANRRTTDLDSPVNEIVNAHLEDEQFIASNGGGASVPHIRPTTPTTRIPGLSDGDV
jgi:hypothetical protein